MMMTTAMMMMGRTFAIALVFPCSTAISNDSAAFFAWTHTNITFLIVDHCHNHHRRRHYNHHHHCTITIILILPTQLIVNQQKTAMTIFCHRHSNHHHHYQNPNNNSSRPNHQEPHFRIIFDRYTKDFPKVERWHFDHICCSRLCWVRYVLSFELFNFSKVSRANWVCKGRRKRGFKFAPFSDLGSPTSETSAGHQQHNSIKILDPGFWIPIFWFSWWGTCLVNCSMFWKSSWATSSVEDWRDSDTALEF